jgi:hypothetical protein
MYSTHRNGLHELLQDSSEKEEKKINTSLCKFKLVAGDIMLIRLLVA